MQASVDEREGAVLLNGQADGIPVEELERICKMVRSDIVRMIGAAASGHPGGSLSCVEALVSLFFYKMNHRPDQPDWPERDRFVLSKGHAAPTLYSVLARSGYFPSEELLSLRQLGSILQGHPDSKKTPGVEISTGSLGQGLAAANGMALGLRLDRSDAHVYCVVGDGESQEGQIWEAAMLAAHNCLDNITVILDNNELQIDGACCDVMSLGDIAAKWRAFGWEVREIDGNDVEAMCRALDAADGATGPALILAHTVKGKGVSFMEHVADFHGKPPTPEQVEQALKEIEES